MTFQDNWSTKGVEEYYHKFIELQERLRKSEEERLQLEMKFNEMIQVTQEEEQLYYKRLKTQYKRFIEENHKRQERNETILLTLERIESRAAILEAKSKRLKLLRQQYHSYLDRIERERNLLEKSRTKHTITENDATLDEIIDRQLTVPSNRVEIDKKRHTFSDLGSADQLLSRFKEPSNGATIADEILRSIYERNKQKYKQEHAHNRNRRGRSPSINDEDDSNDSNTESNFTVDGETSLLRSCKDLQVHNGNIPNGKAHRMKLLDNLETSTSMIISKDLSDEEVNEMNDVNGRESNVVVDMNQNTLENLDHVNEDGVDQKNRENLGTKNNDQSENEILDHGRLQTVLNTEFPSIKEQVSDVVQQQDTLENLDHINEDGVDQKNRENLGTNNNDQSENEILDHGRLQTVLNTEFPSIKEQVSDVVQQQDTLENLDHINEDGVDQKNRENLGTNNNDQSEKEILDHGRLQTVLNTEFPSIKEQVSDVVQQQDSTFYQNRENIVNGNENNEHNLLVHQLQVEQDDSHVQQDQEQEQIIFEENEQPNDQYVENTPNQVENYEQLQDYEQTTQEIEAYNYNSQHQIDENQQEEVVYKESVRDQLVDQQQVYEEQNQQQYDENGQLFYDQGNVQYDESGQAIEYDANGQQIYYDENGQEMHYDKNTQQYQYNQTQYNENGEPIVYDQQNYENYQQYDENGQVINYEQQDQGQEQNRNVYYDENGQPVTYDENGQPTPANQTETTVENFENTSVTNEQVQVEATPANETNVEHFENTTSTEQVQLEAEPEVEAERKTEANADAKSQPAPEPEPEPEERKANVLDFLDTESENTQQQEDVSNQGVANESDFDFSSISDPKLPSNAEAEK